MDQRGTKTRLQAACAGRRTERFYTVLIRHCDVMAADPGTFKSEQGRGVNARQLFGFAHRLPSLARGTSLRGALRSSRVPAVQGLNFGPFTEAAASARSR